jgi:hypothetical protein
VEKEAAWQCRKKQIGTQKRRQAINGGEGRVEARQDDSLGRNKGERGRRGRLK